MKPKTRVIEIKSKRFVKCPKCKQRHGILIWEDSNGLHIETLQGEEIPE